MKGNKASIGKEYDLNQVSVMWLPYQLQGNRVPLMTGEQLITEVGGDNPRSFVGGFNPVDSCQGLWIIPTLFMLFSGTQAHAYWHYPAYMYIYIDIYTYIQIFTKLSLVCHKCRIPSKNQIHLSNGLPI